MCKLILNANHRIVSIVSFDSDCNETNCNRIGVVNPRGVDDEERAINPTKYSECNSL